MFASYSKQSFLRTAGALLLAEPAEGCVCGAAAAPHTQRNLPLAELEPAAGALAAVLLTLLDARVAGQEAAAAERGPELGVGENQGLGDAMAQRAGLPRDPAAQHLRLHVELRLGLRQSE